MVKRNAVVSTATPSRFLPHYSHKCDVLLQQGICKWKSGEPTVTDNDARKRRKARQVHELFLWPVQVGLSWHLTPCVCITTAKALKWFANLNCVWNTPFWSWFRIWQVCLARTFENYISPWKPTAARRLSSCFLGSSFLDTGQWISPRQFWLVPTCPFSSSPRER